jgi:HrpA-like RNA helicase
VHDITRGVAKADSPCLQSHQLVASVVTYIVDKNAPGAILIFMPGVQEIKQCIDALRNSTFRGSAEIFPLHANLSSGEQKAVFKSTTMRKIVVATNVAEVGVAHYHTRLTPGLITNPRHP